MKRREKKYFVRWSSQRNFSGFSPSSKDSVLGEISEVDTGSYIVFRDGNCRLLCSQVPKAVCWCGGANNSSTVGREICIGLHCNPSIFVGVGTMLGQMLIPPHSYLLSPLLPPRQLWQLKVRCISLVCEVTQGCNFFFRGFPILSHLNAGDFAQNPSSAGPLAQKKNELRLNNACTTLKTVHESLFHCNVPEEPQVAGSVSFPFWAVNVQLIYRRYQL